ncbi:MAG: thioredoxin family protein [Ruminococcus sp.]|nr:thioredoxin family protein [Ruminococcus sp.]
MKKKIIIIISLVCIILLGGISYYLFNRSDNATDALKFKEEYESLNDTTRESDGAKYNNINIDKKNPIKYVSIKEAIKLLKEDTGVIYVGANWCPWCRNAIPVLFESAKSNKVKTIYYLNIDDEKDTFEIKDDKLVKTKEGSKEYYELLDVLNDELDEYTLTSKNKTYETGEKRIYMPFVVFFKDGKIVGSKTGTVSLNEGQTKYDAMTNNQHKELLDTYNNLFKKITK